MKISKTTVTSLIFCAILVFAYSHTLSYPFFFDDYRHITEDISLQISSFNVNNLFNAIQQSYQTRPITSLSLAINHIIGELNPAGYRLFNLVIHFLNGLLIFFIFNKICNFFQKDCRYNSLAPLFGALIWFAHPVQTQSTTYIVQRATSLATFFFLTSIVFFIEAKKAKDTLKYILYSLCVLSGILAIGSKEIAITLPLIILLYDFYFTQKDQQISRNNILIILLVFFSFIALFFLFTHSSPIQLVKASYLTRDFTLIERLLTEPRVILLYISLLFFPYYTRFNIDYDFPLSTELFTPPQTLIAILLLVALLIYGIKSKQKNPILSFAIVWFLLNLALESSVIGLEIVFEHRLYLPSIFIFFAIVVKIETFITDRKIFYIFLTLLVGILSFWTYKRNCVWVTPISLWQDTVQKSPFKSRPFGELGHEYYLVGDHKNALFNIEKALDLDNNNFEARNTLAVIMFETGKTDKAKKLLQANLQLAPDHVRSQQNLASIFNNEGNVDGAIQLYSQILEQSPNTIQVYFQLANILIKIDPEKASSLLDKAGKIGKGHVATQKQIGDFYFSNNMYAIAQQYYLATLAFNNNQPAVHNALGGIYFSKGALESAQQHFFTALKQDPTYIEAKNNLAVTTKNLEYIQKNGPVKITK